MKEFDKKPRLVTKHETKLNPIFAVLEQDQTLSLVPRKALHIRNCVVGIEKVV
jgi:hypothetical protein